MFATCIASFVKLTVQAWNTHANSSWLSVFYLACRFKAKGSTGGDVKGRAKVEPYAYWQFDRKVSWL
jgi:hypothetical protein